MIAFYQLNRVAWGNLGFWFSGMVTKSGDLGNRLRIMSYFIIEIQETVSFSLLEMLLQVFGTAFVRLFYMAYGLSYPLPNSLSD